MNKTIISSLKNWKFIVRWFFLYIFLLFISGMWSHMTFFNNLGICLIAYLYEVIVYYRSNEYKG